MLRLVMHVKPWMSRPVVLPECVRPQFLLGKNMASDLDEVAAMTRTGSRCCRSVLHMHVLMKAIKARQC